MLLVCFDYLTCPLLFASPIVVCFVLCFVAYCLFCWVVIIVACFWFAIFDFGFVVLFVGCLIWLWFGWFICCLWLYGWFIVVDYYLVVFDWLVMCCELFVLLVGWCCFLVFLWFVLVWVWLLALVLVTYLLFAVWRYDELCYLTTFRVGLCLFVCICFDNVALFSCEFLCLVVFVCGGLLCLLVL